MKGSITRFPSSTRLPFFFLGSPIKTDSRKKGALIIKGLLGNQDKGSFKGINKGSTGFRVLGIRGLGFEGLRV